MPEVAAKISEFVDKLKKLLEVEKAFTFVLSDPSGNSFIENPYAPQVYKNLKIINYNRSARDNELLGFLNVIFRDFFSFPPIIIIILSRIGIHRFNFY